MNTAPSSSHTPLTRALRTLAMALGLAAITATPALAQQARSRC